MTPTFMLQTSGFKPRTFRLAVEYPSRYTNLPLHTQIHVIFILARVYVSHMIDIVKLMGHTVCNLYSIYCVGWNICDDVYLMELHFV